MKTAVLIVQNAVRLLGVALIVLGFLFWSRTALTLIPLHMRLGETLVALLWILAILAIRAKAPAGLIAAAILWGLVVVAFGMNMGGLLPAGMPHSSPCRSSPDSRPSAAQFARLQPLTTDYGRGRQPMETPCQQA